MSHSNEHTQPVGPLLPGKYAIVAIAVLAVSMASAGVWYQYQLQRRPMAYWGTDTARLLLQASHVEAMQLAPDPSAGEGPRMEEVFLVGGRHWIVTRRRDVSRAPGFSHVRRALMTDGSFAWDEELPDCQPQWKYVLRFTESNESASVFFALNCDLVGPKEGEPISIRPVADAFEQFLADQFPAE